MSKNIFKVKHLTKIEPGTEIEISNFQSIVNLKNQDGREELWLLDASVEEEEEQKQFHLDILPGSWMLNPDNTITRLEIKDFKYYETDTYRKISNHFRIFKEKLNVYKKRNLQPKRAFLFGSEPGSGKSSLINRFMKDLSTEPRTCIIRIDSQNIEYEKVMNSLILSSQSEADFLVIIIEDIGGTTLHERSNRIDTSLLNLLDGNQDVFKIPTMVIATTNYLDLLDGTLTNRPGRFDLVEQLQPPKDEELQWLMEQFLERAMTMEEKKVILGNELTPAYGKEIIIRHELYDCSLEEAAAEVLKQRTLAKEKQMAQKRNSIGFDDDY